MENAIEAIVVLSVFILIIVGIIRSNSMKVKETIKEKEEKVDKLKKQLANADIEVAKSYHLFAFGSEDMVIRTGLSPHFSNLDLDVITIFVNNDNSKVAFYEKGRGFYNFNVDTVIECEILSDNMTVQSGGVGRAIVGGALAGGAGAIVGSSTASSKGVCSSLVLRLVTNNPEKPLIEINLIKSKIAKEAFIYKRAIRIANELYALFISRMELKKPATSDDEPIDMIRKLKELHDEGLLTVDEYETKKKELLDRL